MHTMSLDTMVDVQCLPPSGKMPFRMDANAAECKELTDRFGFAELAVLTAEVKIVKIGPAHWHVKGRLLAELVNYCGVTGELVSESVDFEIEERYGLGPDEGVDIEVSLDGFEPLVNGPIDLGEIVAQSLAIAVNPWPRSEGAPRIFLTGEAAKDHPFAGLSALKRSD